MHPSKILKIDFLNDLNLSNKDLSIQLNIPVEKLEVFLRGESDIDNDLAVRLSRRFGNTKEFWINCQEFYNKEL